MKTYLVAAVSALALTLPAHADDVTNQNGMKCTTTQMGEHQKKVICTSDGAGAPGGQNGAEVVVVPEAGGQNEDVNVQVLDGGKQQRVVIVRRQVLDGADMNKDGKISRKEFLARAEKHFDELDKNHNGTLEGEEMHPPLPPMPPIPGMPPIPPVPPVPPVPPAPPAPSQN